jgi:AcrR family transcriptional regulator
MIDVASTMIGETGSSSFRIADLAERAHVGVPTIYYHFESRTQIIAEAQMANYFKMTVPLHRVLSKAETALSTKDQNVFWEAVHENMLMAWRSGAADENMGLVKLLLDVLSDSKSRKIFRDRLDIQFARWVAVVNDAKELGWASPDLDAQALVAIFWSATVGQVIIAGSKFVDISPKAVGDFYLKFARGEH